jgi:prolyl-tRNA synthetase
MTAISAHTSCCQLYIQLKFGKKAVASYHGRNNVWLKIGRAPLVLGTTHEEIFTAVARDGLASYRQLPQIWYQFQTKYRDELRPKAGLLRVREFTMKDSYSFDLDFAGLDQSFEAHRQAYCNTFRAVGLPYLMVEASSGAMGGSQSVEFMLLTDSGEDLVVTCSNCSYAANLEKAIAKPIATAKASESGALEKFATPGVRTIEDLAKFNGGAKADSQIKTLVYSAAGSLKLFLLRGDHELNLSKLAEVRARRISDQPQKMKFSRPSVHIQVLLARLQ